MATGWVTRLSSQGTTERVWHVVPVEELVSDVQYLKSLSHRAHWEAPKDWMMQQMAVLDCALPDNELRNAQTEEEKQMLTGFPDMQILTTTVEGVGKKALSSAKKHFSKEYYLIEPGW